MELKQDYSSVSVIGETCTDVYIYGHCKRLCPEAPVPIFVKESEHSNAGMAGNVAANLEALGLTPELCTHPETITKTRYVEHSRNHLILRVDDDSAVTPFCALKRYPDFAGRVAVISDYAKGFLSEHDITAIAESALVTFVDTKKKLGPWAAHVDFIKINEVEYKATVEEAEPYIDKLIVTLGDKGCMFKGKLYPVQPTEVVDIAGAGDTFLAALAARFVNNIKRTGSDGHIEECIGFANRAARQVVSRRGVSVVRNLQA